MIGTALLARLLNELTRNGTNGVMLLRDDELAHSAGNSTQKGTIELARELAIRTIGGEMELRDVDGGGGGGGGGRLKTELRDDGGGGGGGQPGPGHGGGRFTHRQHWPLQPEFPQDPMHSRSCPGPQSTMMYSHRSPETRTVQALPPEHRSNCAEKDENDDEADVREAALLLVGATC